MNILCFVADGTEDMEFVTTVDILKRAGINSKIVSLSNITVTLSHGTKIVADQIFNNDSLRTYMDYDGIFFPGGKRGVDTIKENYNVINLIKEYDKRRKPIFAICAAPLILSLSGVLEGRNYTCYDGFEKEIKGNYMGKMPFIRDKNIITGRSAAYSTIFALSLVEYLLGKDSMEKIERAILLKE